MPQREAGMVRLVAGVLTAVTGLTLLVGSLLPAAPAPGAAGPPGQAGRSEQDGRAAALGKVWHSVPVDTLFPPEIVVRTSRNPMQTFTRLGVAPDAECPGAVEPALVAVLETPCLRVLRATYLESTGGALVTAGIVVTGGAQAAWPSPPGESEGKVFGLRALPIPKTEAAGFGDAQRIASLTMPLISEPDAPYLLTGVAGSVDRRRPAKLPRRFDDTADRRADRHEWLALTSVLLTELRSGLQASLRTADGVPA